MLTTVLTAIIAEVMSLQPLAGLGAALGAGIAAFGAGDIRSNMIVIAALIEGVALFAVIVSALAIFIK